jgi:adenylate cyclase
LPAASRFVSLPAFPALPAEAAPIGFHRILARRLGSLAISLAVTLFAIGLYGVTFLGERPTATFDFVQRLELATLDLRFQWRGRAAPDPRIVIVDIDQASQEALGRWPFPRSHFASLLDALRADGARVVAFDIVFTQPDQTAGLVAEMRRRLAVAGGANPRLAAELARLEAEHDYDRRFAEAIERFGHVVLGNFFLYTDADLRGLDDAALARHADLLAYFSFPQVRPAASAADRGAEAYRNLVRQFDELGLLPRGAQANLALLTEALSFDNAATGFFNVYPDPDGVVRRVPLVIPYGRGDDLRDFDFYASLEVQAARFYLGVSNDDLVLNFGATGVESIELGREHVIRPDEVGRVIVNYQGRAGSYRYVSIADVVRGRFAPGTFRDRIVLVGASATGIGDLRTTPFGGLDFPGVEIHANAIDNILNDRFLRRGAPQAMADMAMILLFGVPVGVWLALVSPRWMPLALVLAAPFAAALQWAFAAGWWLNAVVPVVFTLLPNTVLVTLYRVFVEDREKRRVRGAFQQYLSAEVIRQLLENPALVRPRKSEITVLFSDIRGFTTLSEQLDAQDLAEFLNEYLTDMTRIVFERHGTLDKYIGDAVMAFWGAPVSDPKHAEEACRAALEMLARLDELRRVWRAEGRPDIDIGIGVNSGVAAVGNMGSELRYGYTAMGDTVNLSSRLEGLNKEYGTRLLITESTRAALGPEFVVRELDLIRVKGKRQPAVLYELLALRGADVAPGFSPAPESAPTGSASPASSSRADAGPTEGERHSVAANLEAMISAFAAARALYQQRRWREARDAFAALVERFPADGPSRVFLARAETYLAAEPPADWDGVWTMTHK